MLLHFMNIATFEAVLLPIAMIEETETSRCVPKVILLHLTRIVEPRGGTW